MAKNDATVPNAEYLRVHVWGTGNFPGDGVQHRRRRRTFAAHFSHMKKQCKEAHPPWLWMRQEDQSCSEALGYVPNSCRPPLFRSVIKEAITSIGLERGITEMRFNSTCYPGCRWKRVKFPGCTKKHVALHPDIQHMLQDPHKRQSIKLTLESNFIGRCYFQQVLHLEYFVWTSSSRCFNPWGSEWRAHGLFDCELSLEWGDATAYFCVLLSSQWQSVWDDLFLLLNENKILFIRPSDFLLKSTEWKILSSKKTSSGTLSWSVTTHHLQIAGNKSTTHRLWERIERILRRQ
jgi:hypothetical protein